MQEYDVVVVGAGPAGLSAAVESSKDLQTLLIERNKEIGKSQKAWAEFEDRIQQQDLEDAIKHRCKYVEQKYQVGADITIKTPTNMVLMDEEKVLETLESRINQDNCQITTNESFESYYYKGGRIVITTNNNQYNTSILIDCSGYRSNGELDDTKSPVVESKELQKDVTMLQTFAYIVNDVDIDQDTAVILDVPYPTENKTWFWVEPLSRNSAWIGTMNMLKNPISWDISREETKEYMHYRGYKGSIGEERKGLIPSYNFQKSYFDNILLAGDSARDATTGIFFGLVPSLRNGKNASIIAREAIHRGDLSAQFLSRYKNSCLTSNLKMNYLLNMIGEDIILNCSTENFGAFIKTFQNWGDGRIVRRLRAELTKKDVFNMALNMPFKAIYDSLPTKDYPKVMWNALRLFKEIVVGR